MTRLALIFSLLFVTPADAETIIMGCENGDIWKYEEGFFSDTCYVRRGGKWRKWPTAEAVNRSCILNDNSYVDFVSREYVRGGKRRLCITQDRWVR